MKKLLFLFAFVLTVSVSWGQEKIITINPFGKDNTDNLSFQKFKKGSLLKVRINNVNFLKLEGVSIQVSGKDLSFNIPSSFSGLLKSGIPPKDSISMDSTFNIKTQSEEQQYTTGSSSKKQKNTDEFFNKYKEFIQQLVSIEKSVSLENKLKNLLGDGVFVQDTGLIRESAKNLFNSIGSNNDIASKIGNLKVTYGELKYIYDTTNKTPAQETFEVSGELKDKHGNSINISDAKVTQTLKKKYVDEFEFAKNTMDALETDTIKAKMISKAQDGINLYHKIIKQNAFTFYTDAVQLNKDEEDLKPVLKAYDGSTVKEFNTITVRTYSKFRVNFSTGYMLSFIGNETYDYKYNDAGDVVGVYKLSSDKITHAIGGLAHVFFDGPNNGPQLGLSTGISINTDTKINFYGGVSLAFTEKNRIIFTAGLSFVSVKRLNRSNLNADNTFTSPFHQEINYIDRYEPALFFGVTYNLFKSAK
ncbi:MAG: hypothetical protein JXR71_06830 [Bacteroidales bacterium]|nr:hypothetical protein [Bacteroidales bacterium]